MIPANIIFACIVYFFVGTISVSVGGSSLITVPVLISLGMGPKDAVATNMFALIFFSLSGAIGFRREIVSKHFGTVIFFTIITIIGSFFGAGILTLIREDVLKRLIGIVVGLVALTLFVKKDFGLHDKSDNYSKAKYALCAVLVFILGIYGGFFSGGYMTMLSYIFILLLGMHFLQVAAVTKVLNFFSSIAACIIFYQKGLIDFNLGFPLALFMFLGGYIGSKFAIYMGVGWVRKAFVVTVILLAIKLLIGI